MHPRVVYTHYKYTPILLKCKRNNGQISVSGLSYGTTFSTSGADSARKSAFLSNHAGSPLQPLLKMGEGIARVEDLPPPRIERRSRDYRRRRCPFCGKKARRFGAARRVLHDLGDARSGRPLDIHLTYSKHQCSSCRRCFNADMDDLALPKCHYTPRGLK